MKKGRLYIVPTPIGNLEDISLRALRVLNEVDRIACEDTRVTSKLLKHYEIEKTLFSYHKYNEQERSQEIILSLYKGEEIALVSDAGSPGINDPGSILIQKAIEENLPVEVLPGATAATTALIVSGLDSSAFTYLGFIPKKQKEKEDFLKALENREETVILYESVHRVLKTLGQMKEIYPERKIAVCRELTKLHEEVTRGSLEEVYELLSSKESLKGEFVFVLEGHVSEKKWSLTEELEKYRDLGFSKKDAVKKVSKDTGIKRNEVYERSLEIPWN